MSYSKEKGFLTLRQFTVSPRQIFMSVARRVTLQTRMFADVAMLCQILFKSDAGSVIRISCLTLRHDDCRRRK